MKRSQLLKLSAPLVVSFWLRSAFAWIDTIFASLLYDQQGESLGDASIAAIGLTLPLEFLLTAFWVGTSNGLTARLALAMGAGEGQKVDQLKRAAGLIITALGVIFLIIAGFVWWSADRVGLDPLVARQFQIYATVLMAGSAVTSFWSILPDSVVKAHHDTRSTMWAGLYSSIANIVLNALFLFVFHWGIFGIALSTVLGRFAGLAYAIYRANMHERARRVRPDQQVQGLYSRPIRRILFLAVPSAITFVLMGMESMAVNAIIKDLKDSTSLLASWSIFDRSVRFLSMPMIAASVAMLPLAARLYGKGDCSSIAMELRTGLKAGTVYVILMVVPLAIFLGPVIGAALSDSDVTANLVSQSMYWLPLAVLGLMPFILSRSVFDGLQLPKPGLVAAGVRTILLIIPLVWIGSRHHDAFGLNVMQGICAGYMLGTVISGVGYFIWARRRLNVMDGTCPVQQD
ncbi:MAG: MATE family efflux transporter [Planctomycetes bacterium]|nr:MATE family efflux transporter [Planctomycetota bacterium]MCP4860439.1 MATE family efflux transporter [Planctomycetota bacterium]